MPVYTYRGVNRAGANVSGERVAQSKNELAAALRREQINVSKLSEKGKEFNIPTFGTGVDQKELAYWTPKLIERLRALPELRDVTSD